MSTAFNSDSDNPFDASYEEYVRTVEGEATPQSPTLVPNDQDTDEPDDPEVTQASAATADFESSAVGDGVEAPWSNLADTTEGDPFASPEDSESSESDGDNSSE